MSTFKSRIIIDSFSVENLDTSEIDEVDSWLPSNGVMDINIAEKGLIMTLHAQNICQEQIAKVDRLISIKEGLKNKAWSNAALVKASNAGHKTIKNREWFAQADDEYIESCNQLAIAKAAKKWLENKANHFSGWHYAFKTFLKRDYSLERLGNFQAGGYNNGVDQVSHNPDSGETDDDIGGEINWG